LDYILFKYNKDTEMIVGNNANILCKLAQRGASIAELFVPDKFGKLRNIVLSLSSSNRYGQDDSFAGSTLGPCAGRIRDGRLVIDGKHYQLEQNEQPNHLHGGTHCVSRSIWKVLRSFDAPEGQALTLETCLPDGLDGYPGNRHLQVTYILTENSLVVRYKAKTDLPTWLSLSNHSYWNLSGNFSMPATGQLLQIRANRVLYNDSSHLPESVQEVSGTPFDFRLPCSVDSRIASNPQHPQLRNSMGYNNAYLLESGNGPSAILSDPASGRCMRLYTDQPALVFYSGGYLGRTTLSNGGGTASPSCSLALEAQDWPDAPNFSGAPFTILRPGEIWRREIRFEFGITE
jgi:aldose 1-epimerase